MQNLNFKYLVSLFLILAGCSAVESAKQGESTSSSHVGTANQILVGDMLLDVNPNSTSGFQTQAADGFSLYRSEVWPGGILPVEFTSDITPAQQSQFFRACALWSAVADITCVPATTQVNRVKVVGTAQGCSSSLGYQEADLDRVIILSKNCWSEATVAHEIGHLIGLLHEHQRPDRDNYIIINRSAIAPGWEGAYDMISSTPRGPYDFQSIMHYGGRASAVGSQPTFSVRPQFASYAQVEKVILNGSLSSGDAAAAVALYGPPRAKITSATVRQVGAKLDFAVTVAAQPGAKISKVELFSANTSLGVKLSAPYDFSITTLSSGTHVISARAFDDRGLHVVSPTISVIVGGNTQPATQPNGISLITVASPTTAVAGTTINFSVGIIAGFVTKVEYYAGKMLLGGSTRAPYSFSTNALSPGVYQITAVGYDSNGQTRTSAAQTLTVTAPLQTDPRVIPSVVQLYMDMLGRKPLGQEGVAASEQIVAQSLVLQDVRNSLSTSPELKSLITTIYSYYLPRCFGPDKLDYWTNWFKHPQAKLVDFDKTLENVSQSPDGAACR